MQQTKLYYRKFQRKAEIQTSNYFDDEYARRCRKKILIVDDHDDLSTALTDEFSRLGHLVETRESRDEAVELIEDKDFDLVITDLDGEHLTAAANQSGEELTCLPAPVLNPRSNIKAFKICVTRYKKGEFSEEELKIHTSEPIFPLIH